MAEKERKGKKKEHKERYIYILRKKFVANLLIYGPEKERKSDSERENVKEIERDNICKKDGARGKEIEGYNIQKRDNERKKL